MDQTDRAAHGWLHAALWLVAAAFAAFLIGLGGKVSDMLWDAEHPLTLQQFIDPGQAALAQQVQRQADAATEAGRLRLEQARHKLGVARTNTALARQSFDVWIASRSAAPRPDQDTELLTRTAELDQVRHAEQTALAAVQAQEQALQQTGHRREQSMQQWRQLERAGMARLEQARWEQQMRGFLKRLALTAPLLVLAGWLFLKKRDSAWWPFIWGYIFFAAFTFFAELVPYVPSYSGYVRYVVGIVITVLVGRFAILSLQQTPGNAETAAPPAAPGNGLCPGCGQHMDLRNQSQDYCTHCGMHLFEACHQCKTRKAALARFCFSCGTPSVPGET